MLKLWGLCASAAAASIAAACFLGTTACSSSSSPPQDSNFEGSAWTGTISTTLTCGLQSLTATNDFSVAFSSYGGTGLTYTSEDGCTFDFSVSGDVATLGNGPVSCSTTEDAGVLTVTFQSLTYTSPNGSQLTGTGSGTISLGGTTCQESATVSATR